MLKLCYRRRCSKVAVLYFPEYRISSLTTLILSWLSLLSGLKGRRSGCFVLRSASEVLTQAAQWLIISNLWARGENMNVYCESMKPSYWTIWIHKAIPLANCDHPPSLDRGDGRKETRHRNIANCNLQRSFASMAIMLKIESMKGCAFCYRSLLVKLKWGGFYLLWTISNNWL